MQNPSRCNFWNPSFFFSGGGGGARHNKIVVKLILGLIKINYSFWVCLQGDNIDLQQVCDYLIGFAQLESIFKYKFPIWPIGTRIESTYHILLDLIFKLFSIWSFL